MPADALTKVAADNALSASVPSPFGTRYIVDGPLKTPDERDAIMRTVWFIESGGETPVLVTAYPLPRE